MEKAIGGIQNAAASIRAFLGNYCKSKILQKYAYAQLETLVYANLAINLFRNITKENAKEYAWPVRTIGAIRTKFAAALKESRRAVKFALRNDKGITQAFYLRLTKSIGEEFPHLRAFLEDYKKVEEKIKTTLGEEQRGILKAGKINDELNEKFTTLLVEVFVQKKNGFPRSGEMEKVILRLNKTAMPKCARLLFESLRENERSVLFERRSQQSVFEKKLYLRWLEPINLLECLVFISLESIEKQRLKLGADEFGEHKVSVLIQLHARAIQVSNEILCLLKAGFADGANARWRSLHEITIIANFLSDNSNDVAKRYLEHEAIKRYKEAKDFNLHAKSIGYVPLERNALAELRQEANRLCQIYPDQYYGEYGWIPSSIIKKRNFRELEKHVKWNRFRPYYNLACNAVHGGVRGFYRLGLMDDKQSAMLLVGASNYGLYDPLHNTARSLGYITMCILKLAPCFEGILTMHLIGIYLKEINKSAGKVQAAIEREENDEKVHAH